MAEEKVDSRGIRVFVYGTLKEGYGNHGAYLENNTGVRKLGRCYIEGPFALGDLGFFPCAVKTSDGKDRKICGEVYVVDQETLAALDCLEGHPDWYERERVDTPWKKAWCYFMPDRDGMREVLDDGIWNPTQSEIEFMAGASNG